ncbi:MAG: rhodanese-like domain-containing protein [bacterium]|nr:rhodanese-like domain-containing protein [bacterium]
MDRFIEFVTHHYLLAGTLAVFAIAFLVTEFSRGGKSVSPQGLSTLANQRNALLIDIRDATEFRAGHITGSENISASHIASHIGQLKTDPARPIVIICNLGQSAGTIGQQLIAAGLTEVYKLEGGISNWKSQSLPLVKK